MASIVLPPLRRAAANTAIFNTDGKIKNQKEKENFIFFVLKRKLRKLILEKRILQVARNLRGTQLNLQMTIKLNL